MTRAARDRVRQLVDDLAGGDFHRFPTSASAAATFKQWIHVAVLDPAVALVANFSAIPEAAGTAAHRLAVLALGDEVRGHVRRFPPAGCAMPAGRTHLRFGDSWLAASGDVHRLVLDEPALGLTARLALRAEALPSVLHHLPSGPGGTFHWAVVPRLVATGTIELAGRTHAVTGAPAYRDRNWGSFRFGDVSWDWGYAAAVGGPPCAVVFARFLSAGRTRVAEQAILVWWRDRLLASFRGREVGFASAGAYSGPLVTLPPALALCRPGRATAVPETVTVTGRSARGDIELRFVRGSTARIIAPNDARLGTTAIYESSGAVRVTGRIEGCDLDVRGPGFFECVHA